MKLKVTPHAGGELGLTALLLREERREPVSLLDPSAPRSNDFVQICSWCKAVEANDGWFEIEEAAGKLQLMDQVRMPRLSHGICPGCSESLKSQS